MAWILISASSIVVDTCIGSASISPLCYSRFQKFGEKLKTEIGLWELPERTPEVALDGFCCHLLY